jgi:phage anti-repressor protein
MDYRDYDSDKKIIEFEKVTKLLKINTKHAKRILTNSYRENIDYIIQKVDKTSGGSGGHNKKIYYLTINAFKKFCQSIHNEKGNEVRDYFVKVESVLNKYKNSSHKGNLEHNHLLSVLTKMYPTAELLNTSNISASGDIIMKRKDHEAILIENKDYEVNVNPKEIEKFIRDVDENNCHGIFLSQNTGITSKSNYQIEIHNGKILVYIHCVQYNKDKIQVAIDIIDSLIPKLEELEMDDEDNYSDDFILEIPDTVSSEGECDTSKKPPFSARTPRQRVLSESKLAEDIKDGTTTARSPRTPRAQRTDSFSDLFYYS